MIKDKSMRDGSCPLDIRNFPPVSVITEHALGRAAIHAACTNIGISGIPISELGAVNMIRVCHCHNIPTQKEVIQHANAIIAALKRWGGCAGS